MEMILIAYRTDEEEALNLLPEGLELAEPATASIIIANYHFTTWGPYNEAILAIGCTWQGQPMAYLPYLMVTQEVPLIAGREIWGTGKKLARVQVTHDHDAQMGVIERPTGNRLATAVMRPLQNVSGQGFGFPPVVMLKLIPRADGTGAALAQLVSLDFKVTPIVGADGIPELWSGPASLTYNSPTAADPWHRLAVRDVLSGHYGWFNGYVPFGKVLKEYGSKP
jgi:acetoacetate decarboxylase